MGAYNIMADSQAKPGAATGSAAGFIDPVEAIKKAG
jgi:hypothetical protein